jgi:hypothetical protein
VFSHICEAKKLILQKQSRIVAIRSWDECGKGGMEKKAWRTARRKINN